MPRDPATHVGIAVKIDGTEVPCDPAVPGPGILSGLKVVWGRSDRLSIPGAPSCDFEMIDTGDASRYLDLVTYDALVEVLAVAPDGVRTRVFIGYVSDLTYKHDGGDAVLGVTVMHPAARLSSLSMGATPWPAQSLSAREAAMRAALPAGTVLFGQNSLPSSQYRMAALDVDNRTAEDVITDYYKGLGLIPYPSMGVVTGGVRAVTWDVVGPGAGVDRSYGVVDTVRASRRECVAGLMNAPDGPYTPVAVQTVILDACDIDLDGTEFRANPADSGMNVKVTYGPSDDQLTYFYERGTTDGGDSRTLEVTSGVDVGDSTVSSYARAVAGNWALQMPRWKYDFDAPWAVGELVVDPDTVTSMDDFHLAMIALLDDSMSDTYNVTRVHRKVMVQSLPAWTPWRRGTRAGQYGEPGDHCDHVIGVLLGGTYTFDAGRWVLALQLSIERALQSELAPAVVVVVQPGDVVPYDHDDSSVQFQADPATMWAVGEVATFIDGPYGWDGTEWVRGGVPPIVAAPGETLTVAHDDQRVQPSPTTSWTAGQYATFTDGPYRWTGSAWAAMTLVSPGETVSVAHTSLAVAPDPATAWGTDEYATFTDGTWRWDGTAWVLYVAPIPATPGSDVDAPHTDPAVVPQPATRWGVDDYATFTDGRYRWTGSGWVVYVIWTTTRTNLATDPHTLGQSGVWRYQNGTGGASDIAWMDDDDTPGGAPGYVRRTITTADTGGNSGHFYRQDRTENGQPGDVVTLSMHVRYSEPISLAPSAAARVAGVSRDTANGAPTDVPVGIWVRLAITINPDEAWDGFQLWARDPAAGPSAGTTVDATEMLAEHGAEARPYFDGNYPDTEAVDYSWTGAANASTSIERVPGVVPGSVVDAGHDDDAVRPNPTDPWGTDEYATFSDGDYQWNGTTWVAWVRIYVTPGSTVDVAHDDETVRPDPTTAWGTDEYATFSDGTYRWDGSAWAAFTVTVVSPGATVNVPHDDPGVSPEPATSWGPDEYATFSDGTWSWDGAAWIYYVVPIVVAPGDVVDVAHDAEGVTPEPATAWGATDYATFSDGIYRWDGSAWVAVPPRTNLATNPHAVSADGWSWVPGLSGQVDTEIRPEATDTPDGRPGYVRATITTPDTGGYAGPQYETLGADASGAAGELVTFSIYIRPSVAAAYRMSASTRVGRLTGDSAQGAWIDAPANAWTRVWVTVTTTKAYDGLRAIGQENDAGPDAGATVDATQVLIEHANAVKPYFDGDTPDGGGWVHEWNGAAGASTSTATPGDTA